jgi:hypothetical protein
MDRSTASLSVLLCGCLAIASASAGCGGDVLIRKSDETYARALSRQARARAQIEASGASATETQMCLQGEALYQYRFNLPARNAGSYLVQAAAVALELPVLQAFASSLDLFDLRLRTNDGAIQIWESMLAHYPSTPLRPLTLYRLGWAYRSRITPGFPREGPNDAFDLLIREHPTSPLVPLATSAKAVPWKSQETATNLTIFPGLGQIYAGEKLNGATRLAIAVVAGAMIFTPAIIGYSRWRNDELTWRNDWPLLATAVAGLIVFSIDYTLAYQDALRAVMSYNEREERQFEDRHPDAP